MRRLRRVLGPLATIWLGCQVGALTVALPVFWVQSAGAAQLVCVCAHGADDSCPMHHKTPTGARLCLMKSADDSGALVLRSLLGAIGLLSTPTATIVPPSKATETIIASSDATGRPRPPDPPPPRA